MLGPTIIQALGSTGLFASRAFMPAFAAALILRFGVQLPLIHDWGLLAYLGVGSAPAWFTSDLSLLILGVLSVMEMTASKNADARAVLDLVDRYFKSVMAALTTLGVATALDGNFVEELLNQGRKAEAALGLPPGGGAVALVPVAAGMTLSGFAASVAGVGTFITSSTRAYITDLFRDVDEDDDAGLQKLLSWAEDLWCILRPVVFDPVSAGHAGPDRAGHRPGHAAALVGASQGRSLEAALRSLRRADVPLRPGLWELPTAQPRGLRRGPLRPVRHRRPRGPVHPAPPVGGSQALRPVRDQTRKSVAPGSTARAAGPTPLPTPRWPTPTSGGSAQRLPWVLVVCGLLGSLWIIGVIPAVILYRWTLVAPFRRYIPRGRNLLAKWGLRVAFFLLLASQLVPFLGMITVPVMAMMSFVAYRQMFVTLLDNPPAPPAAPPAAPPSAAPGDCSE